jgi:hypothetical protein
MKFSGAISQVMWFNGEKPKVSKTISILVFRGLIWIYGFTVQQLDSVDSLRELPYISIIMEKVNLNYDSSSFSSGHEVGQINDMFQPHDCIDLLVTLIVVQVFFR